MIIDSTAYSNSAVSCCVLLCLPVSSGSSGSSGPKSCCHVSFRKMSSHVYCTGDMIAEECPAQPGAVDFMTEYHSEVYSFMADIIGCDIDRPGKRYVLRITEITRTLVMWNSNC